MKSETVKLQFLKARGLIVKNISYLLSHVCLVFCLFFILYGCEETFQPIGDSETSAFSMYGYLDASADTQWVRVTPLREQVDPTSKIPDMHVTLEHVESGEMVVMKDSLFSLVDNVRAANVYSSELDLKPGQTYRLKAERPDGVISEVTVTIPPDFPTPVLQTSGFLDEYADLFLQEIDQIADVQTLWRVNGVDFRIPYRLLVREHNPPDYDYIVSLNGDRDVSFVIDEAPPPYVQEVLGAGNIKRQVFVASGGPDWMESILDLEEQIYALHEAVSNVENGVGYVIGIVSKTIPFKTCRDNQDEVIACPLEKPMF